MKTPVVPENEKKRLAALRELNILDTPAEERFDRLTRLASQLFHVPIALVSLVDKDRQWFKSKQGLGACETGRDISFCGHAILDDALFEVSDATKDKRFADNPLVTDPPDIRFYAGVPLKTLEGLRVGTLCIIDTQPKTLSLEEQQSLKDMASLVEAELNFMGIQAQSEALRVAHAMGDIITRAQMEFIREADRHKAFDQLLDDILDLTGSDYGFLGQVLKNAEGQPFLKTYAITNIAWDEQSHSFFKEHAPLGMEFTNLNTLFGIALKTGEVVIANDAMNDPRRGGLPKGHPILKTFLGIPVYHADKLVAMIGLANRPQGYDQLLVDFLKPLLATIGQLIAIEQTHEQRRLEQEELSRLSRVASQTTNGVVITTVDGKIDWINEGFTRLTGYTLDELKGRKPSEMLQGELTDPAAILEMRRALADKKDFKVDLVNYHKSGELYWVRISCNPIYNEAGDHEGFIAIEVDISGEKRSEALSRDHHAQIEHQLQAFSLLNQLAANTHLRIQEQLEQALKLGRTYLALDLGIVSKIRYGDYKIMALDVEQPSSLETGQRFNLGETYCDLVIQEGDLVAVHHMAASEYSGHPCYRAIGLEAYIGVPLYVEDKTYGTLNFSSGSHKEEPFSDSEKLFMRLLARWVSAIIERDRSARALRRNESRLRGLFELSPIGIALNDFQTGQFLDLNPALLAPTGYTRDEFVLLSYWDITPIEYKEAELAQIELLRTTGRYGPYEKEYIRKDGSRYPVLLNGMVVDESDGRKLIWSIIEDISERKRIERMKNEFIATVSHELRTPLTAISGALGLIKGGVVGELSGPLDNMLDVAFKNSQRLNLLINDLLDMEKLLAGKMLFQFNSYSLKQLLQQAIEVNQSYADQFNVDLYLVNCSDSIQVRVDETRFAQIMSNLLSNASKFSPPGKHVEITVTQNKKTVRISVRDFGEGIPAEFHHQIFQKFSQADGSDSRQKGGTGLGLAISREMVERMNGVIDFETSIQGTSFFFDLPVIDKEGFGADE